MIILSKKKILCTMGIITMCIFAYAVTGYNVSNNQENKINVEAIQTVALPVDSKVIIIDARTSEYQMREHKAVMEQQKQKAI